MPQIHVHSIHLSNILASLSGDTLLFNESSKLRATPFPRNVDMKHHIDTSWFVSYLSRTAHNSFDIILQFIWTYYTTSTVSIHIKNFSYSMINSTLQHLGRFDATNATAVLRYYYIRDDHHHHHRNIHHR